MDNQCNICEFATGSSLYEHFREDGCPYAGRRLLNVSYIDKKEFDEVMEVFKKNTFTSDYFSFEPTIK